MQELENARHAELEMGCGFGATEIYNAFAPQEKILNDMMAESYGMTPEQYEASQYEWMHKYGYIG